MLIRFPIISPGGKKNCNTNTKIYNPVLLDIRYLAAGVVTHETQTPLMSVSRIITPIYMQGMAPLPADIGSSKFPE